MCLRAKKKKIEENEYKSCFCCYIDKNKQKKKQEKMCYSACHKNTYCTKSNVLNVVRSLVFRLRSLVWCVYHHIVRNMPFICLSYYKKKNKI